MRIAVKSRFFPGVISLLIGGVSAALAMPGESPAQDRPAEFRSNIFHSDSEHAWNRLHTAIFVREGPDGRLYGLDRLDPLLFDGTRHLLVGESHQSVLKYLDVFLCRCDEPLMSDLLKRAVLQRDLWAVFDWLCSEREAGSFIPPVEPDELKEIQEAQQRLHGPLARAIACLALSPDQIEKLPDNYALAVAEGAFPKQHDPKHAKRTFLPSDLFDETGPWVCLGRSDGPVAPQHVNRHDGLTRSAFLVFVRVPGGREATIKYLKQLVNFDKGLWVKINVDNGRKRVFPSPHLPRFPVGTQMALVRRMMLIDSHGHITPTKITESVQLRVYREIPQISRETLLGAYFQQRNRTWQDFYEIRLSRTALFANRVGGLKPLAPDAWDFKTDFRAHYEDQLDWARLYAESKVTARSKLPVRKTCLACHALPGVLSFNTFLESGNVEPSQDRTSVRPSRLLVTSPSKVQQAYVTWKKSQADWKQLQHLLEARPTQAPKRKIGILPGAEKDR